MQSSPPGLRFETPYITQSYGDLPIHKTAKANSPCLARPLRLDYVQHQRDGFPTCPVVAGQVRRAASPPGAVCHTYKRVDEAGVERVLKGGAKGVTHLLMLFLTS